MDPFQIFVSIVLPIFVLMALGFALDRAVRLDIRTLAKVQFNIFTPVVVYATIVRSELQPSLMASIGLFAVLHAAVIYGLAWLIFATRPFREKRMALVMSSVYFNAGNYGFPLMLLAFGETALSVIAIVLVAQVILMFTVGLAILNGPRAGLKESLRRLIGVPAIYGIIAGFVVRAFDITMIPQIAVPVDQIYNGFIAISLLTLGAQLSRSRLNGNLLQLMGAATMRLAAAPALALALTRLGGFTGVVAQTLIVSAGLPTAVNVFVISHEFNAEPEFASQIVFWTTLLSAVSIPVLLWLVR
jgi:hypothetical protein